MTGPLAARRIFLPGVYAGENPACYNFASTTLEVDVLRSLTPIGHCSPKLRRKLEIEEEEALAFCIKVRRRKPDEERPQKTKGGRWFIAPDFSVPGPFWHRPLSPEGRVTFHFAWTIVSRSGSGGSVVSDSRGRVSESQRSISEHDHYVSRDGAVLTIGPAKYDEYAAKVSTTNLSMGMTNVALLTNISLDPAERERFWDAVHVTASKRGPDRLVLERARGTKKEWKALAGAEEVPADIRNAAASFAGDSKRRKAEFPMTEDEAKTAIELICRFIPNADRKKGPVRFARGRNGRTQYRLETELPDGIDDAARLRIMVRVAEAVESVGAMYTLALHEPDEHNDKRNYHLHLVAYDRPAKLIDGEWDITIREAVEGQRGRTKSKRQKKVSIVDLETASKRGDFEAFLKQLRFRYSDFCNEELVAASQTRLFDPRTYKEMGIDRSPTRALGSILAPLEAVGVPTNPGTHNAEVIWTYELRVRIEKCREDGRKRQAALADLRITLQRLHLAGESAATAAALLAQAERAAKFLENAEVDLAEYEVTLQMVRARPTKTVDTCSRILAELDAGRGTSTDRRNRARINDRLDEAERFLDEVSRIDRENQKVIAEQLPLMDAARRQIASAEAHILALKEGERSVSDIVLKPTSEPRARDAVEHQPQRAATFPSGEVRVVELAQAKERPAPAPATVAKVPTRTLDEVIARIKENRLLILGPEHHGGEGYRVAGVTRDELRVLRDPSMVEEAQAQLELVFEFQRDEIKRAFFTFRSFGPERARDLAASSGGRRPTIAGNPLGVLEAYREHPDAARRMGWGAEDHEKAQVDRPSLWRRVQAAFSAPTPPASPDKDRAEHDTAVPLNSEASWTPAVEVTRTTTSSEEAIAKYAEVIRTDRKVRLVDHDGEARVDPSSVPGWEISAAAFEDHEVVKAAVEERWSKELEAKREIERQDAQAERFRAGKRAQIIVGLERGELLARRRGARWVVEGQNGDLVYLATAWGDHPELVAAYEQSVVKPLRTRSSPNHQPVIQTPAKPHTSLKGSHASSPARGQAPAQANATPSPTYTAAEQKWYRDQQKGQFLS